MKISSSPLPLKARYNHVFRCLCNFYDTYGFAIYPFNPVSFIKKHKWILSSFQKEVFDEKTTIAKIKRTHGNALGNTYLKNNEYVIVYDADKPIRMILFTLAHEISHILLNHLIEFEQTELNRGGINKTAYKALETEADVMAKNLLAPYHLIKKLQIRNWETIFNLFNTSKDASKNRLKSIEADENMFRAMNIDEQTWLSQIDTEAFLHYNKCPICGYLFKDTDAKFCAICGNQITKKTYPDVCLSTNYNFFDTYDQHLDTCPKCKQNILSANEKYCKICGVSLKNFCQNCNTVLNVNARYCEICGNQSTYFKYLPDWKNVYDFSIINEKKKYNLRCV